MFSFSSASLFYLSGIVYISGRVVYVSHNFLKEKWLEKLWDTDVFLKKH